MSEAIQFSLWEVFVIACTALLWLVLAIFALKRTRTGAKFFQMFGAGQQKASKQKPFGVTHQSRIIAVLVLLVVLGATTMFYLEWLSIGIITALSVSLLVSAGYFIAKYNISHVNSTVIIMLLLTLFLPVGLCVYKRSELTDIQATVVWVFVLLFWVVGIIASRWTSFSMEVLPIAKTRPLMALLLLSVYCILFSTGDVAALIISVVAIIIVIYWSAKSHKPIFALPLASYQQNNLEMTTAVALMFFLAILNFSLMFAKDHSQQPESLWIFNTLLFVVAIMVIIGVFLSNNIEELKIVRDKVGLPLPSAALDVFGRFAFSATPKSSQLLRSGMIPLEKDYSFDSSEMSVPG
jgi:hypothetical protein